jgi:uncharacterized membrane protein YcaP (DUF421 family)
MHGELNPTVAALAVREVGVSVWRSVFGEGERLGALQMSARAMVMFFIALVLVRVAGMRTFGRRSAFDHIVVIMLGAVLARGVVGASPFGSTVAAGVAIVVVHRILAQLCRVAPWLERYLKGEHRVLYRDGVIDESAMARSGLTGYDLIEGVRHSAQVDSLGDIAAAYIESNGEISAVKRPPPRRE